MENYVRFFTKYYYTMPWGEVCSCLWSPHSITLVVGVPIVAMLCPGIMIGKKVYPHFYYHEPDDAVYRGLQL